jgi:hypothetical protein
VATADGRIYFASAGKTFVIRASTEHTVMAVNDLGDGGEASPAVSSGRIVLKGRRYLFCVGDR